MKTQTYNKFKKLLIDACDKHIAEGGRIIAGRFTNHHHGYCPISCALGYKNILNPSVDINDLLGSNISEDDCWGFIVGFDSPLEYNPPSLKLSQMFRLGRSLRRKYIEKR